MLRHRMRRQAFTLTEILITVGVLVVLFGLLLPAFERVRAQSRSVKCSYNLHQIDAGLRNWSRNNHDLLPDGASWAGAVVDGGGTETLLHCPDGTDWDGISTAFVQPEFDYSPNNNHGHPVDWTVVDADHQSAVVLYQKNKPDQAVIDFRRAYGGTWVATVMRVDPRKPYGGPPIDMLCQDGTKYANLQVGQQIFVSFGGKSMDYGYNLNASSTNGGTKPGVLVMDYAEYVIDYDGRYGDDDPAKCVLARHMGKLNVLYTDSSVRLTAIGDLQPATKVYQLDD